MYRRNQPTYRRQAYKSGSVFRIGPTTARYFALLLLAIFSLLYLVQSAQGADGAVKLHAIDSQQTELGKEMTNLQINASRLQSLQSLQDSANKQGLVPIGGAADTLNTAE